MKRHHQPERRNRFRPTLDRLEGRALMTVYGPLDSSFGVGGVYSVPPMDLYNFSGGLTAVTVESDGTILAAGDIPSPLGTASGPDDKAFGLLAVTSSGTLDTSFGTNGEAILPVPGAIDATLNVSLTTGGQIIVGGTLVIYNSTTQTTTNEQIIARYNTDGTLDTTYGTNGLVTLAPAGISVGGVQFSLVASDFAVGSDGSVVFTGAVPLGGGATGTQLGVARLTPQGTDDTTFGTDGLVRITGNLQAGSAVAIQSNGQILVAGVVSTNYYNTSFEADIYRLNGDGSIDNTLSESGIQAAGFSGITLIQPQSDGTIVVAGFYRPGIGGIGAEVVVLLNSDGTLNSHLSEVPNSGQAFNAGSLDQQGVIVEAKALAPDGSLVVVGFATNASGAAMNDVVARLIPIATPGDYNGDGISDPAIYLPSYGDFAIGDSTHKTGGQILQFGIAGPGQTIPAPGDYYATGQDDIAAYLPSLGVYAIQDPTGKTTGKAISFGIPGLGQTIPAPGDYYDTGQADVAVYLTALGDFAIQDPTGKTTGKIVQFGIAGAGNSIPVPGDYYGTGQDDIAVFLPTIGAYAIQDPTGDTPGEIIPFGMPGIGNSIPMPGDYDGSGKTELAVYVPSLGAFFFRPANGGPDVMAPFGIPGDGQTLPMQGDYTGSGKTELGVYLPTYGLFAYQPPSVAGPIVQFGIPGAGQTIPVTSVVLSPFPGTPTGPVSASSIEEPGLLGEPDTLDFLPTTTKKPKASDASA